MINLLIGTFSLVFAAIVFVASGFSEDHQAARDGMKIAVLFLIAAA